MRALKKPARFLLDYVAEDLDDRLAVILRNFERALILGSPRLSLSVDRVTAGQKFLRQTLSQMKKRCPSRPLLSDLAVSLLSLHLVNDLPGSLIQLRRALKPDGLLMSRF